MKSWNSGNFWFLVGALTIIIPLVSFASFEVFISRKAHNVSIEVRPAVVAILKAQYLSQLTGGYWENELATQEKYISKLQLKHRLDYYRAIIIECDLDGSRALAFIDSVGPDSALLYKNLSAFKHSAQYDSLTAQQKKSIDMWSISMKSEGEPGIPDDEE